MNTADPLAELHDIVMPEAVGLWPLALGWWLLLVFALVLLGFALYGWKNHRQTSQFRRAALTEWSALDQYWQTNPIDYLYRINQLMKRCALAQCARSDLAALNGSAWIDYLNRSHAQNPWTGEHAELLAQGHYRPQRPDTNWTELHRKAGQWLKESKPPC